MSIQRLLRRVNITPSSSASGSSSNPTGRNTERKGDKTCVVCLEDTEPTRVLDACRHAYCQADLRRLVEAALEGRGTWPPRCCGERNRPDEDDVQWALESDPPLYDRYLEMRWERNAPIKKKGRGEREPVDRRLKALMRKERWRSCRRCGRVIEKTEGCDHISCRCGHEFCYVCGSRWQTCGCAFGRPRPNRDDESDDDSVAGADTDTETPVDPTPAPSRARSRARQTNRVPRPHLLRLNPATDTTPQRQREQNQPTESNDMVYTAPQNRRPQQQQPSVQQRQPAEVTERINAYEAEIRAQYYRDVSASASRAQPTTTQLPNHQGGDDRQTRFRAHANPTYPLPMQDRQRRCGRDWLPDWAFDWGTPRSRGPPESRIRPPPPEPQERPILLHPIYQNDPIYHRYALPDPIDDSHEARQPCAQCIAAGCPYALHCSGAGGGDNCLPN